MVWKLYWHIAESGMDIAWERSYVNFFIKQRVEDVLW